ncbi:hypothetical protein A1F94_009004 [Pyrenophora tritici-repentis]|nr:hypothetical protein PtrV1_12699 [Pyrenophora tritici-repentis]KAF7445511.1 hypothetical protein A1F99_104970 [Pyrenophora tritici-repentis]KAG9380109.1 hypothetical protein A1F94_009004 [Pyrenophora tritici-repentis]KAI1596892.1 hypothetical protein PtrCC142_009330 [Pyrenophora tritici-repentis]PWO23126.1 hypothetical protein PtrARCrB10_08351 [Pyrenophora tritici-repentis]
MPPCYRQFRYVWQQMIADHRHLRVARILKLLKRVSKQTMGYTHYWRWNFTNSKLLDETWSRLVEDTKAIVKAADIPLCKSATPGVPPVIDVTNGIHLNGADSDDYEDLFFHPELDRHHNEFCKTGERPYDVVVTAILLRASMLFGSAITVSSDGHWADWQSARYLISELWPEEEIECLFESDEEDEDDESLLK